MKDNLYPAKFVLAYGFTEDGSSFDDGCIIDAETSHELHTALVGPFGVTMASEVAERFEAGDVLVTFEDHCAPVGIFLLSRHLHTVSLKLVCS